MKSGLFQRTTLPKLAFAAVVIGIIAGVAILALGSADGKGYPVNSADSITSWNFRSSYAPGSEDEKRVLKEIDTLKGQLTTSSNKYELEVGIANEYMVLGRGKEAYRAVSDAIALNPNKGLGYFTLGRLMEQLGALHSAKEAYDMAVAKEPGTPDFRAYRDAFLTRSNLAK